MCSKAGSYLRYIDFVSRNSRLESNKEECGAQDLVVELELDVASSSSSLLLSSLELSDTKVYEP